MSFRFTLALLYFVIGAWGLASAAETDQAPTDEEIRSKLVGEWIGIVNHPNGVLVKGENDYRADGTIITTGSRTDNNGTFSFQMSGKWNVKDGVITITVEKSSHPEMIPIGDVSTMPVVSISDKTLRYKKGNEIAVRYRKIPHPAIEDRNGVPLTSDSGPSHFRSRVAAHVVSSIDFEHRILHRTEVGIKLAIDSRLQAAAEQALSQAPHPAAAVVLDVRNGDVLALVSQPSFDPNKLTPPTRENWKQLTDDPKQPLANRAIQKSYSPGSTLVVPVALAALNEKIITPQTTIDCSGSFKLNDIEFRCWEPSGHGKVNLNDAIKNSCNVYFYNVGNQFGPQRLCDALKRMGFGEKTGIDLDNENEGLVPSDEWVKQVTKGQQAAMSTGEAINASIGQGAINVTPLQMAVFYAAVANGGDLYRPRLILSRSGRETNSVKMVPAQVRRHLDWHPEHRQAVVNGLIDVVKGGTGKRAQLEGVQVAGKTGSAQFKGVDKQTGETVRNTRTWFAGFVPANQPKYAVVVVVEGGEAGGSTAAPIAREIFKAAMALEK